MPIKTSAVFDPGPAETIDMRAVPYAQDLNPDVRDEHLPLSATTLLGQHHATGEAGEVVEVPVARGDKVRRILLYGTGDGSAAALRKAARAIVYPTNGAEELTVQLPPGSQEEDVTAMVESALLATYTFEQKSGQHTLGGVSDKARSEPVRLIRFTGPREAGQAVQRARAIAKATARARDLTNEPSSTKTPQWLADQAEQIARQTGLEVKKWGAEQLKAEGFGGILAVGQGSANKPCLIRLSYEPEGVTAPKHVVLVGKGLTFDSGGLSLKPADSMERMKTDMAGGAVVIAVMSALRELRAPVRVTGLIPAAENMPSGTAQRPADVVTQYGGRMVEVTDTDAEGRLVLADALAYADAELDPKELIDVATLTGAVIKALGHGIAAVFASADDLADELIKAGEATGDRLWAMPLVEEYTLSLDSDVADLANTETGTTYSAGAITAALFLREFTGGRRWAHLDIAGVADNTDGIASAKPVPGLIEDVHEEGATGFGVRLLLEHLTRRPGVGGRPGGRPGAQPADRHASGRGRPR